MAPVRPPWRRARRPAPRTRGDGPTDSFARVIAPIAAPRLRGDGPLTQEMVAHRVPMDRSTYIRIERGQSCVTLDSLLLIARVIGVPVADLIG
ncbi:helix-turn-helix domain-containing protein [Streptomyces hydrogenans]|uniref:helix-turn-helix domain-containing protein n=1 Tax=Streptomyces hydrogenans TaxID=1873719 RepID=UPI003F4E1CDE